jgi:hypothetical protein
MGVLRLVWLILAGAAAIWLVASYWSAIVAHPLNRAALLLGFGLCLAAKIFAALQMRMALTWVGQRIDLKASFFAYSAADIAKYVPGGIWAIASRVIMYRQLGMSHGPTVKALALEQIWLAGAAAAVGGAMYVVGRWDGPWTLAAASLGVTGWTGLMMVSRYWLPPADAGRTPGSGVLLGVQAALWLLAGGGFAVLAPDADLVLLAGAFCLAFSAGLLVPFAPGGVGVRESVALALLIPMVSTGDAARLLLVSRGLWIVADATFAAIALTLCRSSWTADVTLAENERQ